jgi:hypothetical protein
MATGLFLLLSDRGRTSEPMIANSKVINDLATIADIGVNRTTIAA